MNTNQMLLQDQYALNLQLGSRKELLDILRFTNQYDVCMKASENRVFKDKEDREIIDFASGNYLGFDKRQEELLPAGIRSVEKYGLHLGRARLTGHNYLCREMEERLANRMGSEDILIVTNTFLGSIGIIPALIEKNDLIIMDKAAHATMFIGAQLARDKGAILESYPQKDLNKLEDILKKYKNTRHKMICVDGVYSITGDYANLIELKKLAYKFNALIFVDDAHGFGLVGQNQNEKNPYGDGSGIVKHFGLDYENIFYIAGTAKNLSSALAFTTVSKRMKEVLLAFSKPLDYSQQPIPFSLGILDGALNLLDREGEVIKFKIYQMRVKLFKEISDLGYKTFCTTHFPILSIHIGDTPRLIELSKFLYDREGIYITSCPYPTMPKGQECVRVTITAANELWQIQKLISAFKQIKEIWQNEGKWPLY